MSAEQVFPFDSEASYQAAIDTALAAARREIRIFDRDLLQMALGDKDRAALLANFLTGGRDRRLRIVLHDIGPLEQRLPRLIDLIRLYGHLIEVRHTPDNLLHLADRWLLVDATHGVVRFHADHARGKLMVAAPKEIEPWWRRFEDLCEESEICSPGATTGL